MDKKVRSQLLLQLRQPPSCACVVDLLEGDAVEPWSTSIRPAFPVSFEQYVPSADLVPQAVETIADFGFGFRLQCCLQLLNRFVWSC